MESQKVKRSRSMPRISPSNESPHESTAQTTQTARAVSCLDCPAMEDCRYHVDAKRIVATFPARFFMNAEKWSEALAPFCKLFTHMKPLASDKRP